MRGSIIISKILSAFLLLVFALSITPKRHLHTIFAKHTDAADKKNNGSHTELNHVSFNCDTDNLVSESTFLNDHFTFSYPATCFYSDFIISDINFFSTTGVFTFQRGPPVIV